ncbi:MAG: hypothetical protein APG12_00889 [Candidatus Methanofastidiosum methylothiophilum]|uniref:Uncharacterized protein n=1 Tax=Candidatus Methanofastidiosum methylothiophilum TaxID=1705564 RepID=A0A150IJR0_9EURY|nr:MAG: hypothetical protein APG10_01058 [Candidatus Methanofastidiosum methylthiophilus]KYC47267.1 MAG: hypothetical protein APG11_01310 [Candidatus Methanofastidiosum methylthiophilus]KYC50361.1 MAG: hypothetical protein APG12_00889 [Candidatus Methanofastidiosum methylthiophilus]
MNINRKWIFIVIAAILVVGILYFGQESIFNFKNNPKISANVNVLSSKILITNEEIGILSLENKGKSNAIEIEVEEISPFTVTFESDPPLLLEKGKTIALKFKLVPEKEVLKLSETRKNIPLEFKIKYKNNEGASMNPVTVKTTIQVYRPKFEIKKIDLGGLLKTELTLKHDQNGLLMMEIESDQIFKEGDYWIEFVSDYPDLEIESVDKYPSEKIYGGYKFIFQDILPANKRISKSFLLKSKVPPGSYETRFTVNIKVFWRGILLDQENVKVVVLDL